MKFIKKVFISLSVIVLLFCSIFLSPKSDDYFKGSKVHAEALSTVAVPFFALNPELIPVFLLGVFVLTVCGIAINNVDKIVAAGTQLKNTIEEAGESVSTYVTNAKQILVNEAFKIHVKNTIDRMSKTRYSNGSYKFDTLTAGSGSSELGEVGLRLDELYPDSKNRLLNATFGGYSHFPLLKLRTSKLDTKDNKYVAFHEYAIELADTSGDVYSTTDLPTSDVKNDYPSYVHLKPVTSISTTFNHPISKADTGGKVDLDLVYLRTLQSKKSYGYSSDFGFNLFNYSNFYLQKLASIGIIYEPKIAENGDILSFRITVLNTFAKHFKDYRYLSAMLISQSNNSKEIKLNALDTSGPITVNDVVGSNVKERSISYPNASLLKNSYDKATIEKSLDIAFPNTLDNLVPLDNVLTKDREIANLKELDNVLDYSARFLDESRTRGLDNVLTDAKTLDLSGIDEGASDKALDDTFNVRDYALDNVRVATAGIGAVHAVNDDTANVGAGANAGARDKADWLSKVPFLGKLWDFLKEIIRLLNAILKAILDAIINAMKATAAPILNVLNAIMEWVKSIAKGRSVVEVITQDLIIGNTDALVSKLNNIQQLINAKFPNIKPLNLNFTDKPAFDDFKADIPHVGTVTIISADMMNRFAPVAKNFFAGLFFFLTGLFFFKKYYKVSEG